MRVSKVLKHFADSPWIPIIIVRDIKDRSIHWFLVYESCYKGVEEKIPRYYIGYFDTTYHIQEPFNSLKAALAALESKAELKDTDT